MEIDNRILSTAKDNSKYSFNKMFKDTKCDSIALKFSDEEKDAALALTIIKYLIHNKKEKEIIHYIAVHLNECDLKDQIFDAYDLFQFEMTSWVEPRLNPAKAIKLIGKENIISVAMYLYWRCNDWNDAMDIIDKIYFFDRKYLYEITNIIYLLFGIY